MPVILVVSLACFNLGRFVALCATFDRVSFDAVLSQGVAPDGEQTKLAAVDEVQRCIEETLDMPQTCTVEVSAEPVREPSGTHALILSPFLTRFRCALVFRPWPSAFTIAGVVYDSPVVLRHERALVVDRFKPGVVM